MALFRKHPQTPVIVDHSGLDYDRTPESYRRWRENIALCVYLRLFAFSSRLVASVSSLVAQVRQPPEHLDEDQRPRHVRCDLS